MKIQVFIVIIAVKNLLK